MVSPDGWIDGITASGVVVFGIIFGLFFFYVSRKRKAKLLFYLGLANLLAGLMFLGVFLDFLLVVFTENNIDNTNGLVGILSYIWFAPVVITAMFIGAELIAPKMKWYIVSIIAIVSIVFEIVIFMDPLEAFFFDPPTTDPPETLIDYNVNLDTLAGLLVGSLLLSILIFLGIGFIYKAIQSTGEIKRNFYLLSLGSVCFCIFGLLEGLTAPGFMVIIVRIGYLS
ncbi:MAG: hypothetical protein ACFE8L_05735, partial [Candidatus Hodarchaeota archaeon]